MYKRLLFTLSCILLTVEGRGSSTRFGGHVINIIRARAPKMSEAFNKIIIQQEAVISFLKEDRLREIVEKEFEQQKEVFKGQYQCLSEDLKNEVTRKLAIQSIVSHAAVILQQRLDANPLIKPADFVVVMLQAAQKYAEENTQRKK